jgi:hypothetical protein
MLALKRHSPHCVGTMTNCFDLILQRARDAKEDKHFLSAVILHLIYFTAYFAISCLTNKTSMRRRVFLPLFADMVSFSRTIL